MFVLFGAVISQNTRPAMDHIRIRKGIYVSIIFQIEREGIYTMALGINPSNIPDERDGRARKAHPARSSRARPQPHL